MNNIKLKLFIWKHPSSMLLPFVISVMFVPLIIIPYFFVTLAYFLMVETNIMQTIIKQIKKYK